MGDKFKNKIKKARLQKERQLSKLSFPASVAERPSLGEFGKEGKYRLIFKYYNHGQCELKRVQKFKPLIDIFNYITQSDRQSLRIKNPVKNEGGYRGLFIGLPPDADLEEIDYTDVGRGFFFRLDPYFCIVAVNSLHR